MDEVNRWVFTICCGAALCGVVSVLLPAKSMEKLMGMVLGLFMLCCFLLPVGLELDLAELEPPEAASAMEDAARKTTEHFLADTLSRSQEELRRLAVKELQGFGINEKDIQIYIEADEGDSPEDGDVPRLTARIVLPGSAGGMDRELRETLEKKLDVPIRLEYDGEGS